MDVITRDELQELMNHRQKNSVSIFMPTIRYGQEVLQNPIRLKNLIDQIEMSLKNRRLSPGEITNLISPIHDLLNHGGFWQDLSESLAIFRSLDIFRTFKLPIEVQELALVNDRFYAKPLLPMLEGNGEFYLLALNMNNIRLLKGDRFHMEEVDLGDMPTSMEAALGDENNERALQFQHGTMPSMHGDRSSMFFSQGTTTENRKKEQIQRFFQVLEKGVTKEISRQTAPLILAGVEYLIPIYRETNGYPHLYEEHIAGNPDGIRVDELHKQAWQLVEPFYQQPREGILNAYHLLTTKEQATKDPQQIIPASYFGQVDTLLVSEGLRIWGTFDPNTFQATIHDHQQPGDEDLTDLATVFTLANNGTVYTFDLAEMPDGAMIAATLRYPMKGLDYRPNLKT